MPSIPPSYQSDLTPENEHTTCCVVHPDRVAQVADVDDDGQKIPVCYECWQARYPAIRARLRAMGFCKEEGA